MKENETVFVNFPLFLWILSVTRNDERHKQTDESGKHGKGDGAQRTLECKHGECCEGADVEKTTTISVLRTSEIGGEVVHERNLQRRRGSS